MSQYVGFSLFLGSFNGKILPCGFHHAEFDVITGTPLNRVIESPLRKSLLKWSALKY
jgi:nitrite reductase/ring-hydroxylating ferredoxin subunit